MMKYCYQPSLSNKSNRCDLQISDTRALYIPVSNKQHLISELWAIRGKCDELKAGKIAKNANLPLKWLDKVPGINSDKGIRKLKAERNVLLLRRRIRGQVLFLAELVITFLAITKSGKLRIQVLFCSQ